MSALFSVENLSAGYGQLDVLHEVSLQLNEGEKVAIIGANGAGKTTLLESISGLITLRSGKVTFAGESIENLPAHDRVTRGIALVPEGRKIFSRLTVLENLELGAFTRRGQSRLISQDIEHIYSLFPILKDRWSQPGGTLSGGEQQMLAIGRAIMSRPKLLLLDEPSMGVAPIMTEKIFQTLLSLNKEGMSILLVEQNAHLALKFAERAYVMETGKFIMQGAAESLLHDPAVKSAYLGEC